MKSEQVIEHGARDTSIQVYHEITEEGIKGNLKREVYRTMRRIGPCSDREILQAMTQSFKSDMQISYVVPRRRELYSEGWVILLDKKRPCKTTGRTVCIWEALEEKIEVIIKDMDCPTCGGTGKVPIVPEDLFDGNN